jgi:hypothetical protein
MIVVFATIGAVIVHHQCDIVDDPTIYPQRTRQDRMG